MKRNQLIIVAVAAILGLWLFSKSGNAGTANCDGVYSYHSTGDTTLLIDS